MADHNAGEVDSKLQLKAFMQKSLRVKFRSKRQLICEIVPPLIFLLLALVLSLVLKETEFDPVSTITFGTNLPSSPCAGFEAGAQKIPVFDSSSGSINSQDFTNFVALLNQHSNCSDPFVVSTSSAEAVFDISQEGFVAGIDVTALDPSTQTLSYTLRMPRGNTDIPESLQVPSTRKTRLQRSAWRIALAAIIDPRSQFQPCDEKRCTLSYALSGFSSIQLAMNRAFFTLTNDDVYDKYQVGESGVWLSPMPRPKYVRGVDYSLVGQYLGYSYVASSFVLCKQMLAEKERKIKEGMSIMSMKTSVFWIGWFLTALISVIPISILVIIGGVGLIFKNTAAGFVLIAVILFALSLISMTFLVYTLFERARTGGLFILIAQILAINVYQAADLQGATAKFLGVIMSPFAFMRSVELMAGGMDDPNATDYSYGSAVAILFVDCLLYLLLAWYADKVKPGTFGVPLPWYFCFSPSYWCGTSARKGLARQGSAGEIELENLGDRIQPLPQEQRSQVSVRVTDLGKVFQTNPFKPNPETDKVAVKHLTFEMVRGQVFSLLGHNGAGKTTTMQMLCGMTKPSSGEIVINDMNVATQIVDIRKSLGYCPQHDVLYDELSVEEHLELYGKVKGVQGDSLTAEIDFLIQATDLVEKRNNRVGELSGGMKRKLSLAIAYIGNPSVVVLDEPTSGMDPLSRRKMWELILKMKANRTTLLTTHFLDEADILGDRVGIMASGNMRCLGTSLFLKNRFGLGYNLGVVKNPTATQDKAIHDLVTASVPEAEQQTNTPGEQSFRLPTGATSAFPNMLRSLAQNAQACGIISFGMSITTLEEVFLKIADESDDFKDADGGAVNAAAAGAADELLNADWAGSPSMATQAHAVLLKRFWQSKRSLLVLLLNLGIPALLLILGAALSKSVSASRSGDPALLDPSTIWTGPTTNLFFSNSINLSHPVNMTGGPRNVSAGDKSFSNLATELLKPYAQEDEILNYPGAFVFLADSDISDSNASSPTYVGIITNHRLTHNLPVMIDKLHNYLDSPATITATTSTLLYRDGTAQPNFFAFISFLSFAFCFPTGYIGVPLVAERASKGFHLMKLMGLHPAAYWGPLAVYDFVFLTIPTLIAIIFISVFDIMPLSGQAMPAVVLIFFLYQFAAIPFTYVVSRLISEPENFQLAKIGLNFLFGFIGSLAYLLLDLFANLENSDDLELGANIVFYLLNFFPLFACITGVFRIGSPPGRGVDWTDPSFSDVMHPDTKVTQTIGYQVANIFIYMILIYLVDYLPGIMQRWKIDASLASASGAADVGDDDIQSEKDRLLGAASSPDQDMITVRGLRKVYPARGKVPPKVAVEGLYVGIPQGEVFGLLGANGAGKTTTMKILTGDFPQTNGEAVINGNNIANDISAAYRVMGYCPQFDALWTDLTGREHLRIFSMLKGVPADTAETMSDNMLGRMALSNYADRLAGTYSGGNKRKLSVTIALMANPKVVYLDEPSTGMDPASRRFMWSVIQSSMKSRAVVLTTHSMEEADALCNRIGIMVNGQLKCLGSSQHLKNKFGAGLQIEIHTAPGLESAVESWVKSFLPTAHVIEAFAGQMSLEVEQTDLALADVFEQFEVQKGSLQISEYSISQTTLEKVFLRFARGQIEEDA